MFNLNNVIEKFGTAPAAALPILQEIQRHFRYLPEEVLREVVAKTEISARDLYGVATFYDQFRFSRIGEHVIRVCTGTACHVQGAERVRDAFRAHLKIADDHDTDTHEKFTVCEVACLGCCTLAPVVQIDHLTYGHVKPSQVAEILEEFAQHSAQKNSSLPPHAITTDALTTFRVGMGSCCQAQGSADVCHALEKSVQQLSLAACVERVGCVGMCHQTPLVEAISPRGIHTLYAHVTPNDVDDILHHVANIPPMKKITRRAWRWLERFWSDEIENAARTKKLDDDSQAVRNFRERQCYFAMEHGGALNPASLEDYQKHGGFAALEKFIAGDMQYDLQREAALKTLEISGLRGRGGAGFPTHIKWRAVAEAKNENENPNENTNEKFIICNGDEGDPGAFMDRMLLESFPFRVIEGMLIAARVVGATSGLFYIRAEYPLAVARVRAAIETCYAHNLLGEKIGGSDFSFDLSIKEGAGAFVCGEETALLESIEGRRGTPRLRPPFPATRGLFGKPTLINNVETFSLIPFIFREGGEKFAAHGTAKSRGTKVFALAGKVKRGGLIEVPMGITLDEIVSGIGGGTHSGKSLNRKTVENSNLENPAAQRASDMVEGEASRPTRLGFKAVQIGGPSGGCLPYSLADTPIDFESLINAGGMMGSGGLVVLDENDCMVDMAKYFLHFTQMQSCGKCTWCRVGTRRMLDILERLTEGRGKSGDLERLEKLAKQVQAASLCGLGRTAPNPILSTLRHFREEYESHINGNCPAGKCAALIDYIIGKECNGCTLCAQICATRAIAFTPYQRHKIDTSRCVRCGGCREVCPQQAVLHKKKVNQKEEKTI